VDDEPSIRLTLPPLLEEKRFRVTVAASVPDALEIIKNHKFDVLLCDTTLIAKRWIHDRKGKGRSKSGVRRHPAYGLSGS